MAEDIVVYNLQDNGAPVDSSSSDIASPTLSQGTPTAETYLPSGQSALAITEGDVRVILKQEMEHWTGDIRVGALLSGQVFILDSRGMMMGGTEFSTAPFSVDYNGRVTGTSGVFGGFELGTDYIRDTANSFGLASTVTGGDDVRFWAGNTFVNRAIAPARISESGAAVFSDVTVSGTIRSSVFEKDVVSAVGGQLIIANADALDTAMTALDASTLTIKGETTFAVNDILHIKDGTDEEYLRVTSVASAPIYSVTRDLAGAYSADANPAWSAGTAVVVEGSSDGASTYSGGFLKLLGSGTNSPRYSVYKRTGVAYNAITEYIGIGNINGLLDYVAQEYGIVVGTQALGYMAFDPTNGLRVNGSLNPTTTAVAGENITAGDAVCIRTNEIVKAVATHDAKVLESSAGTNYGTDTTATVGSNNATNNGDSYCFIKFDLTTIAVTIADKVYLRLQLTNSTSSAGDDFELNAYQVTGADWDESTITWTNKPAINASIDGSWEFSESSEFTDDYLEESSAISYAFIDITTLYNAWKGGTNNYGVAVRFVERGTGAESTAATRTVDLGTSENATVALRPTLIVSGVSDNIGKVYKANATNFTDLLGPTGISLTTTVAAATDTIQRSGIVTNQSSLTPGKTYFITDSETISTTAGTVVRPIGTALSSTNLSIIDDTSKIVIDNIFWSASSGPEDHNITNTIFLPIGFSPKLIRFDGTFLTSGSTYLPADGIWYNGTQLTTTNDVVTNGYLIYYVSGNRTVTLTVTSVHDSGVLLTVQLKDTSGASSEAVGIKGILTFQA